MKKAFLVLAALALGISGCSTKPAPTPDERTVQFIKIVEKDGHKVDKVDSPDGPAYNAGWETETEKSKKRKANGKTITVKKNTRIAEVVVVIPDSNCKIEFEALLDGDLNAYYADEGRDASGKEMELPADFPVDRPSPRELKEYLASLPRQNMFSFCIGKPYKASAHADD